MTISKNNYAYRQLLGCGSSALSAFICHHVNDKEPTLLTNLPGKNSIPKLSLGELTKAFMDRRLSLPGKNRSQ